jgi:alpha-beta hydrolase superfamily lysophospholipase
MNLKTIMNVLKKRKRLIIILCACAFLAFNLLAWMHGRAMMTFSAGAKIIKGPEDLSFPEKIKALLLGVRIPRPENKETPAHYHMKYDTFHVTGHAGHRLETWYIPSSQSSSPQVQAMVVLFHGYAKAKDTLLPLAASFHEKGFACLLVDFYGSGGSSGASTTVGVYEAEDVAAVYGFALKQWPGRDIILYGVSMGGAAILRAAALAQLDPPPTAIILESPFNRMLTTVIRRFRVMGVPSFPSAQALVFWGGVHHGFNAFKHNPAEYARSAACPAMVLHGAEDRKVFVEDAKEVFQNLAGPKAFKSYPGVGHRLIFNHFPKEWQTDVTTFIHRHL